MRSSTGEEPCVDLTSQLSSQHENSCRKEVATEERKGKAKQASNQMSARRADYCAWTDAKQRRRGETPPELAVEPCETIEPLADIRGSLKKLKHDSNFLFKIFENRDRQLYPRDLLVASVPSRKKGKRRPIGILRRSFCFDPVKKSRALTIDFVWVLPEFRSCGIGRQLMSAGLIAGKPKDVHLQVAGSDDNHAAVALYTSLGFRWDEAMPKHTEMLLEAERVEAAAAAFGNFASRAGTPSVSSSSGSSSRSGSRSGSSSPGHGCGGEAMPVVVKACFSVVDGRVKVCLGPETPSAAAAAQVSAHEAAAPLRASEKDARGGEQSHRGGG